VKKTPDKKFLKRLGKRIKTLRLQQNISQDQLAFETKMRREQVIRIEFGRQNTSIDNLKKIADAFEIRLKDLFDFEY
jgi:transcriptional regulator with XRE-family HTH domain